jgi:hypothetical protein
LYQFDPDPYLLHTGIPDLDRIIGGFKRRELICILGGYKGKKSFAGIHIGGWACLQGKTVFHITHENTREETEERYDRWAGAMCHRVDGGKPVKLWHYDGEKMQSSMVEVPCITDIDARLAARNRLRRFGGRLIIKKFPMGHCRFRDLVQYLDYMEQMYGLVPDLLINDYPDIMDLEVGHDNNLRHALNKIYIAHKGLADERNIAVLAFSQAVRKAIRAQRLSMRDFAEDIRKLANVDMALAVCQTDQQALTSMGSIYVLAARGEKMDQGCGIVMNLDVGQFCTQSFHMKFITESEAKVAKRRDDADGTTGQESDE